MGIESRLGGLVALLVMAGCTTVGPDYHRPELPVPEAWPVAASDAPSMVVEKPFDGRRWWSVFRDGELDRLVDDAVAQNLDLQTAALRIAVARTQRDATASNLWPSAAANGVAGRSRMSENGITSTLGGGGGGGGSGGGAEPSLTSNLYQVGFDATWELDLWGKTRRSIESADAQTQSAEAQRNDAVVSLTAEVVRSYLALRGAQRQLAILQAEVQSEESLLRLTQSRADVGLSPTSDVISQRTQLASVIAQLPQIRQTIDQSTNRIALLLALPPGALRERLGATTASVTTSAPLPPEVPIGLPGELLRRRPDVRRSEAELHSATANIGVAEAQLFPSIQLGLFGGLQATSTANLFDWASRFIAGGAELSMPLYQGGKLRAQVRISDLQAKQAALNFRQTVLSAYHDAGNALIAYADEQQRATALQQQLADARRKRELALSRYRSGLAPLIELLDAERGTQQAESQSNDSLVTASTNLVALYKSLGGGWETDATTAAP